jgi:hypothetical protein
MKTIRIGTLTGDTRPVVDDATDETIGYTRIDAGPVTTGKGQLDGEVIHFENGSVSDFLPASE